MTDLFPEGACSLPVYANSESNLTRFVHRHTLFGVNPIATFDLPPPLPPVPPPTIPHNDNDDDISSIPSSRAASVQPSDLDIPRSRKLDRFGRDKANSPNPQTVKQKKVASKRELPPAIMDFLAALPPAAMFDGATFYVDELVKLIRDAGVPYPVGFVVKSKRGRGDDDDDLGQRGTKKYRDD